MAKEKKAKKEKKEKKQKTGKGGKKKLLLIPIVLVVLAAAGFAVFKFVLPMLGGGDSGEEKLPKKLEAYTIGEDTVPSLDTVLEEGEGELLARRGPGKVKEKKEEDASGSGEAVEVEAYTYIYEITGAGAVMDRYLDLLLGEEQGFSLVDEDYLIQSERPVLEDAEGAFLAARASVQEGRVFQLAVGWSDVNDTLAIRVAAPEGQLRRPEPEKEPEPASLSEQLDELKSMDPKHLTLPGGTMSDYEIYPVEGFVTIDGQLCRRFNIYEVGNSNDVAGIIFYSGDMQHLYRMDPKDNSIIMELK